MFTELLVDYDEKVGAAFFFFYAAVAFSLGL
jgi:hypothetical protein